MRETKQERRITGFYDEYQRNKAKKQQVVESTQSQPIQTNIIKIKQPPTIRTYGRVRLFFYGLFRLLKYLVISILLSLIVTLLLNNDIRTMIIQLLKNIFTGG